MSRLTTEPSFSRPALAPGLLAAVVLLAGLALLDTDWFTVVLYVVSILAIIDVVFAVQARAWWWLAGLLPIAVLWNPVWPLEIDADPWRFLQLAAAGVFLAVGFVIRVPVPRDGHERAGAGGSTGGRRPRR